MAQTKRENPSKFVCQMRRSVQILDGLLAPKIEKLPSDYDAGERKMADGMTYWACCVVEDAKVLQ